jgi:arylsulfatase A-like enzyme
MSRMTHDSAAPTRGTSRFGRFGIASVLALALGACGCASAPTGPEAIDITRLGYGLVDGRFTPLTVEGDPSSPRLVQPDQGDLDVFLEPPPDAALVFDVADGLSPDEFAVAVYTDTGPHPTTLVPDEDGSWRASLAGLERRSTRIRFTNRSGRPLTWIRPRVVGDFLRPTAAFAPPPPPANERYNVLLYVIDTLRADHLSCYGYERETPRLDALAERGTLFERAYSPASSTPPTMTALLASRHPSELRDAGYSTAAFQANLLLRPRLGYGRGFERYELPSRRPGERLRPVRAATLHERILAWLEADSRAPFFIWVQSMDVHEYDPVPPFAGRYTSPDGSTPTTTRPQDTDNPFVFLQRFTPDYYDETDAYADHLAETGVLERTIVIVTADHGEPLGEHSNFFHGMNVFEEVVHVPLIVSLPWDPTPRRIERITSLLDLAPTILDLVDLPTPASFNGRSLLEPPDPHERVVAIGATEGFKNSEPSWFLRSGPWKVVMDRDHSQLFHLPTDPDETTDVSGRHPVTAQDLSTLLVSRSPEFRAGWKTPPPWDADLDAAEKERLHEALEALGYVQ